MALRRFIGGMDGVSDVAVEGEMVPVDFDEQKIAEESIRKIAIDSIERRGFRIDKD
jgi:hypothetical protein